MSDKHHEIAEMLDIAESTSKSNLSRAKAILVERLTAAGIDIGKPPLELKSGAKEREKYIYSCERRC